MNPELYLASKKLWSRNRKAIKEPELPLCSPGSEYSAWIMFWTVMGCFWLLLLAGCNQLANVSINSNIKEERIDYEKFVTAIKHAEGLKSRYPYGVKSVPCSSEKQCRAICTRRVRHLWSDFKQNEQTGIDNFIRYASIRYVGSTKEEIRNWQNNVQYWYDR